MSHYLDVQDGRVIRTEKRGRTKKGYQETSEGVWTQIEVQVEESLESYPVNKVFMWLNSSSNNRSAECISLYLCNVSPKCPFSSLASNRYACRIDLDLVGGAILVWRLSYEADAPDLIIENALLIESNV